MFSNEPDAQMDFWHALAQQKVTDNDEAFHGLLLFLDASDPNPDYASRVKALEGRRLLPADFADPADQAVTRGVLAVALVKALHIDGGLALHLFGPTQRYAVRELVFQGLYPPSSENQTFNGTEFLGIIGKMEDYQKARRPLPGGLAPTVVPMLSPHT